MVISCDWTANSNSSWRSKMWLIKCLPQFYRWTSSVWWKCSAILRKRKWSWTILCHSISVPSRPCHYTDFVLHNVPSNQVVLIDVGTSPHEMFIPRGTDDIKTIIAMLNASDALFDLVYDGDNAFHITVNHFYTIDFTNAPEIQSILGFESSVLMKGLDNPRQYFLRTSCNQIVKVANG